MAFKLTVSVLLACLVLTSAERIAKRDLLGRYGSGPGLALARDYGGVGAGLAGNYGGNAAAHEVSVSKSVHSIDGDAGWGAGLAYNAPLADAAIGVSATLVQASRVLMNNIYSEGYSAGLAAGRASVITSRTSSWGAAPAGAAWGNDYLAAGPAALRSSSVTHETVSHNAIDDAPLNYNRGYGAASGVVHESASSTVVNDAPLNYNRGYGAASGVIRESASSTVVNDAPLLHYNPSYGAASGVIRESVSSTAVHNAPPLNYAGGYGSYAAGPALYRPAYGNAGAVGAVAHESVSRSTRINNNIGAGYARPGYGGAALAAPIGIRGIGASRVHSAGIADGDYGGAVASRVSSVSTHKTVGNGAGSGIGIGLGNYY